MKIIIAVLIFVLSAVPVFQQSEILAARKIDINTASYEELQEITWVGPAIARRIRESRPFYSLDDIIKVRGIGEKRLEDIKKQGLAWVNPETKPIPGLERKIQPEQEQKPVPEQELQPSPKPLPWQQNKVSKSEWIWKTKVSKFFGIWNALERKNMPVFVMNRKPLFILLMS